MQNLKVTKKETKLQELDLILRSSLAWPYSEIKIERNFQLVRNIQRKNLNFDFQLK